MSNDNVDLQPFGEATCEDELKLLGENEYSKYYFHHTRFNVPSLDHKTYLIVGRRGAGKTSLAQHFTFQKAIKNAISINVMNEPELFQDILTRISSNAPQIREIEIPRLAKIWNYLIWHIIFFHLKERDPRIAVAALMGGEPGSLPHVLIQTLKMLLARVLGTKDDSTIITEFEQMINDTRVQDARQAVFEIAKNEPVIIAIDTLENYSVSNTTMTNIVAALIQCASDFRRDNSSKNVYLKIFVMAEVFPYLKEQVLLNPLKHVQNEVYLHWRPKDLMRLICWRFHYYLKSRSLLRSKTAAIDWDNYSDVLQNVWEPFFGKEITNGSGLSEKTFPYVLRHTQMRPRQLILLCNSITNSIEDQNLFKGIAPNRLIDGIRNIEDKLSEEVFNSYNTVYPNVGNIVDALSGIPVKFKGSELDKRAPISASQWPSEREYSAFNFRQLVAELGVVGRIRQQDESNGFIEADFEYASEGRLPLLPTDDCVIHPMFYKRLNVHMTKKVRVYPFPDHPEFKDLNYL